MATFATRKTPEYYIGKQKFYYAKPHALKMLLYNKKQKQEVGANHRKAFNDARETHSVFLFGKRKIHFWKVWKFPAP